MTVQTAPARNTARDEEAPAASAEPAAPFAGGIDLDDPRVRALSIEFLALLLAVLRSEKPQ